MLCMTSKPKIITMWASSSKNSVYVAWTSRWMVAGNHPRVKFSTVTRVKTPSNLKPEAFANKEGRNKFHQMWQEHWWMTYTRASYHLNCHAVCQSKGGERSRNQGSPWQGTGFEITSLVCNFCWFKNLEQFIERTVALKCPLKTRHH